MRVECASAFLWLAIFGAYTVGCGDDTATPKSTGGVLTDTPTTDTPTTDMPTTDTPTGGVTGGASTGTDTGGDPVWPPPFMPTPTVDVVFNPGLTLGDGPCIHICDPAIREGLPRVMDLCDLLGGDGRASGSCDGATCPVPAEMCMIDEFEFSVAYCALDGLPPASCGAYAQQSNDHIVVSTRIAHRLVGAQLTFEFAPDDPTPAVQVNLQEGWDMIDDMGVPSPIPARLAPTGGTITLKSPGFTAGATLSGAFELDFASPDDPSIARTIRGHFDHVIN